MSDDRGYVGTSLLFFLAGAAIGATIVALTTPKTGPELRGDLKGLGNRVKDRISHLRSQESEKDLAEG
jgi:gas vesicle protein